MCLTRHSAKLSYFASLVHQIRNVDSCKAIILGDWPSTQWPAELHHGWIPEFPGGASGPLPDIFPQPYPTSPIPANGKPQHVAIRTPGIPKARGIAKETREAHESFERMERSFLDTPCT